MSDDIDISEMLQRQRAHIKQLADVLREQTTTTSAEPVDVVALWRSESSEGALRFVDRLSTPA